jgi:predicted RNase H-like HicB family nuclease
MDRCYVYTVKLTPLAEGGYGVTVPRLPGCHTWGKTYEDTVANAKEAIQCYIKALQKIGSPVPVENRCFRKVVIQVRVPAEG